MTGLHRFWQVVSIDAPWAISNWLWANAVHPLAASVAQMTPRRLVYVAAFVAFAIAFTWAAAELSLSSDMALLLAGDSALYFEVATVTYIALVRARMDRIAAPAIRILRRTNHAIVRTAGRTRRSVRLPRLFNVGDSGDVPDGAFVLT
jgi:hypothetical protein